MNNNKQSTGKARKIFYWFFTLWLSLGMVSTAGGQLFKRADGPGAVDMLRDLGYPMYLLALLGVWKILGTVAVLIPRFPLLKEWAYAGFFFLMTGAIYSHLAANDPAN